MDILDYKKKDGVYFVDFDDIKDFPIKEITLLNFIEHTEVVNRIQCLNYLDDNALEVIAGFLKSCENKKLVTGEVVSMKIGVESVSIPSGMFVSYYV